MAEAAAGGIGLFGWLMITFGGVIVIWLVAKGWCRMIITPAQPIAVVMPATPTVTVQVQYKSWALASWNTVAASFTFAATGTGLGAASPTPGSVPAPTTPGPFGPTTFTLTGAATGRTAILVTATSAECGTDSETIQVVVS